MFYIHQVLHKAIGQAVKWGLVSRNVTNLAEHPNNKQKTPVTLSIAQVKQLLDFMKEDRLYPLYLLVMSTGMREGELLGLHWEDLDLDHEIITVRHQAQEIWRKGMIIKEPKTEAIKLPSELTEKVLDYLRDLAQSKMRKTGLVFQTSNGSQFSQRS